MPDQINISMSVADWNQAVAVLSEAPYKVVANIIMQIANQAQQQQPPQMQQPRPTLRSVDEPA